MSESRDAEPGDSRADISRSNAVEFAVFLEVQAKQMELRGLMGEAEDLRKWAVALRQRVELLDLEMRCSDLCTSE